MSIRFNCPHCQKTLKVPTEHGGKRARCPGCKKAVNIPSLDPAVTAEIEELAAAALTDEPKVERAEASEAKPIKFTCDYCDEEVEVAAEMAGQQTPCPECRRIVKVPIPVKKEPLDWRKVTARGPAAGLRRDEPTAPEGAWGSTSITQVSGVALREVQALEKPPLTKKQWIKRGVAALGVVMLIGAGAWAFMSYRGRSLQAQALKMAAAAVPESGGTSLGHVDAALLHRALAEYAIREGNVADAKKHLTKGQAHLSELVGSARPTFEAEAAAFDLTVTLADMFGSAEQALAGTKVAWADAPKELRGTLKALASTEARAETLRRMTRKLLVTGSAENYRNMGETLASLMATDADRPEMFAVAGLELLQAGAKPEAEAFATRVESFFDPTLETPATASPSVIALLTALAQDKTVEQTLRVAVPRFDAANPQLEARLGYATGWALQGNWERAAALANAAGSAGDRFQALTLLAMAAGETKPEEARKYAEAAIDLAEKELGGRFPDAWTAVRFARVAHQLGLAERMSKLLEAIPDAGPRVRAQAELLKHQLESSTTAQLDALRAAADDAAKSRLVERHARHAARHGDPAAVLDAVNALEPASLRPFGHVGAALGMQDKGR